MNVLVINAGSSSLKYQLLNVDTREVYAKGNCERIGIDGSFVGHEEMGGEKQKLEVALPDHKTAIKYVFDILKTVDQSIDGIGHRVVQGGWYFPQSAVITDETLGWVREVAPLAPLHNYAEADVIEICREMFPEVGNVVVCDTSFHYNMPKKAYTYALPRDVVEKLHIRKYGAHGTSHRYIWRAVDKFTGGQTHKLVSCHLGSGASLSAIEDGKDKDTTMGLTPLDGLIMGTRCGTLDPATVFYLSRVGGYSIDEIDTMMNKQSGLLALSGHSDSRDIEDGTAGWHLICSTTALLSSLWRWLSQCMGLIPWHFLPVSARTLPRCAWALQKNLHGWASRLMRRRTRFALMRSVTSPHPIQRSVFLSPQRTRNI